MSAVLLSVTTHAFAQVTLDLHALQALPDRRGVASPRPVPAPVQRPATPAVTEVPPPAASMAQTNPKQGNPVPPPMPGVEPESVAITPIAPAPPAAGSEPPPPPVSDKAVTAAAATEQGLRLIFAAGETNLSPDSMASLKQLTGATPMTDTTSFNVLAYAPASPDDASTARRLSLSRAMAVRSALIAQGISSARVYVRAMGAQNGNGPADRVDVNVLGANAAPAATPAAVTTRP